MKHKAALANDIDHVLVSEEELDRIVGEMAAKILTGEANVAEMPIEYTPEEKLAKKYNKDIAEALGYSIEDLEAKGYIAIEK